MSDQIFKFRNDLIEAYKGRYEDDRILLQDDGSFKERSKFTDEEFNTWVEWMIISDKPLDRLTTYLEWNGIQGYTNSIYDIAMGKFSA